MPKSTSDDAGRAFVDLLALMATLRSDEGCAWDREQTHASLKRYLIEEAYELLEAIDGKDDDAFVEELGDVLLQVIFHAQIAAEGGRFTMSDVVQGLSAKLIRRHPHVFGDEGAEDAEAVLRTWNEIKRQERSDDPASLLASVPTALPGLMEAEKIQQRAARVGFQWDDVEGAWDKVREELDELRHAADELTRRLDEADGARDPTVAARLQEAVGDELGDVLFAVVNVARYLGVDPEQSLRATNAKFRHRFAYIEEQARSRGRSLEQMDLADMDELWDEAKTKEKRRG